LENDKAKRARKNEVGYCGDYCRNCYWYTDALRKPTTQLLDLIKSHFEVAGWINYKGGNSTETTKGLEILSKAACAFNCKGGGGWGGCSVRTCCTAKSVDFCFDCIEFPCEKNWGEKSEHANIFSKTKKERLQKMKEIGVEEWIRAQWE
jgi:hypothetical protein